MHDKDALLGEKIDQLTQSFNALKLRIDPVLEAYDSVIFGKKFLIGLSTVIGSIAAVGAGIFWVIDYIRHG